MYSLSCAVCYNHHTMSHGTGEMNSSSSLLCSLEERQLSQNSSYCFSSLSLTFGTISSHLKKYYPYFYGLSNYDCSNWFALISASSDCCFTELFSVIMWVLELLSSMQHWFNFKNITCSVCAKIDSSSLSPFN